MAWKRMNASKWWTKTLSSALPVRSLSEYSSFKKSSYSWTLFHFSTVTTRWEGCYFEFFRGAATQTHTQSKQFSFVQQLKTGKNALIFQLCICWRKIDSMIRTISQSLVAENARKIRVDHIINTVTFSAWREGYYFCHHGIESTILRLICAIWRLYKAFWISIYCSREANI